MRTIGEFDLELLEAYLDDALSPAQVEHVAQRLLAEPELAAAMHDLRAERALRRAAWRCAEPTAAAAATVAGSVCAVVRRQHRRRAIWRAVRIGSAAAAAISVFLAGWIIRGKGSSSLLAQQAQPTPIYHSPPPQIVTRSPAVFPVEIKDKSGKILAVQKFEKLDEARQFADDLARYEARRRDVQQGGAVLVSDRF